MILDLMRFNRRALEGEYKYETDRGLPKDKIETIWFMKSDIVIMDRDGNRTIMDGEFVSTENLKIGQLFRHVKSIYEIVRKKESVVTIYKYLFRQVDED